MCHAAKFALAFQWMLLSLAMPASLPNPAFAELPKGVYCDCVIELRSQYIDSYELLFVNYVATSRDFSFVVIWHEPRFSGSGNFACRPELLYCAAAEKSFEVRSPVQQELNAFFERPFGARPRFDHVANAYDVLEMRYAIDNARLRRIPIVALRPESPVGISGNTGDSTSVSKGNVSQDELVVSQTFSDWGNRQTRLKTRVTGRSSVIVEESVEMSEQAWDVAAVSGKLLVNGEEVQAREPSAPYHRGGRRVSVKWAGMSDGNMDIRIPQLIQVVKPPHRNSPEKDISESDFRPTIRGGFLRRATVIGTRLLRDEKEVLEHRRRQRTADSEFAARIGLSRLLIANWRKQADEVTPADRQELARWRTLLQNGISESMSNGETVRRWNLILHVDQILQDGEIVRNFVSFLNALPTEVAPLSAEYCRRAVVDDLRRWKQHREADEIDRAFDNWMVVNGIQQFRESWPARRAIAR